MKIGIIIHSQTGNTLLIAEKLKDTLTDKGHIVLLERVTSMNDDPKANGKVTLQSIPDITPYDFIFIGAPVHGFSLSAVMKAYLAQIPRLQDRRIVCFVTEYFPKPWMGGNHSIKQMIYALQEKGAIVVEKGIINWSSKLRDKQIDELVTKLSKL